jgi:hypothetical protein
MRNLERRLLTPGLDNAYVMCIHRANLDAMGGRVSSTIGAHATAVKRRVQNCALIRKTPTLPACSPMPLSNPVGMDMALDMLFNLLTAQPWLKGESHIQFDSMRCPRGTFTSVWDLSPGRIQEGSTFTSGGMEVTVTMCPTQQRWLGLFLQGAENRMKYVARCNQPLGTGVINKLLATIKEEVGEQDPWVAWEYVKVGAAMVLATCASLRGLEVFLLDLAGLQKYHDLGRDGILPDNPLKTGTDLLKAPYIIVTLIGEFKGELGIKHHLIALSSLTSLGIELCWWIKQLMRVRMEEGCWTGPAFGNRDGTIALMTKPNDVLHHFMKQIQEKEPQLIAASNDVGANYSFLCTFRRTAKGRPRGANLDIGVQNTMNCWRKIEEAKGKCP